MGDDDRDDPDRAAILARRQRFIAVALGGLSVACGKDGKPQPCLDIAPMTESVSDEGATSTDATSTGMPMPCLDIAPTASVTADGSSTTDESGTSDDTTDGTTGTSGG